MDVSTNHQLRGITPNDTIYMLVDTKVIPFDMTIKSLGRSLLMRVEFGIEPIQPLSTFVTATLITGRLVYYHDVTDCV